MALQGEIKKLKEMLQQYTSGTIKMEPSTSGMTQEGDNTSYVSDSEWKERFIQAMLLRENCAQEKIKRSEQVKQHPMVPKYSMKIKALKSQLKHERTQNDNTNRSKADFLMELDGKYKELTQYKKIFTPAQTPKEENVATATVEKYKNQVNNLQEEVAKLKQQLTENAAENNS
ncbi:KIF15 [Mytilus edulis]|uniref:KIF15 n=1 Tax=Mytilus edulis TaxID=6550 RepID=A0A8S3VL26_MYTED|nr:KIF15 [Mytilus edulis]